MPLDLIECDAGNIYDRTITALSEAVGEPLYPGDERRMFAEALVAVLVPMYNAIEDAASQTALRYARGSVLDALGERLGVQRLGGTDSKTILRFTLSAERDVPTIIPKWTKATADSEIYFATDVEAVINAGELSVEVPASATGAGERANGYLPGAITTLVDKIPYVASVENTVESHDGSDGELYDEEGDDRFRERIRIAVSALSVAGPERAYEYWAKSADAGIADVAVISETEIMERKVKVRNEHAYLGGELLRPDMGLEVEGTAEGFSAEYTDDLLDITLTGDDVKQKEEVTVRVWHQMDGRVRIVPLMEDGESPSDDVIQRVYDACNARDVRPMTDVVRVDKPTRRDYDIELTYWTSAENEATVVDAVEGAGGAIDRYVADQDSKLGRDINPDVLKAYVMDAGAIRVDVVKPEYTQIEAGEAAKFSTTAAVSHHLETRARWD